MGNIYKALRRNLFLAPAGDAFKSYLQQQDEEEKRKEWMQNIATIANNMEQGYAPRPNQEKIGMMGTTINDPFLQDRITGEGMRRQTALSNLDKTPNEKIDYEAGKKNAIDQIYNYLIESTGKDIDPNLINQGLTALQLKASKYAKPETKTEPFTLDQGDIRYGYDDSGNLIKLAENPKTQKEQASEWGFSKSGFWRKNDKGEPEFVPNKSYKSGGGNDYEKDYTVGLGKLEEANKQTKELLKPNKNGKYMLGFDNEGKPIETNFDEAYYEANLIRENLSGEASTLIRQQKLLKAVEDIRTGIKNGLSKSKGKSKSQIATKAVEAFIKEHPELNEEQQTILKTYFELFTF